MSVGWCQSNRQQATIKFSSPKYRKFDCTARLQKTRLQELVVHLVIQTPHDNKSEIVSIRCKQRACPEKAGVDSSILSLGTIHRVPRDGSTQNGGTSGAFSPFRRASVKRLHPTASAWRMKIKRALNSCHHIIMTLQNC